MTVGGRDCLVAEEAHPLRLSREVVSDRVGSRVGGVMHQKHIGGSILRSKSICNVRLSDLLLAPVRLVHLAPLTVHRVGSAHRKEPDSANGESQCPRQMKDVGANRAKPCVG